MSQVTGHDTHDPSPFDGSLLRKLLWPIGQLRSNHSLSITSLSEETVAYLHSLPRASKVSDETLVARCSKLHDRASKLKDAMSEVKGVYPRQDQLLGLLYDMNASLSLSDFVDADLLDRLHISAAQLDEILASSLVTQVEAAFNQQIRRLRKIRNSLRG